MSLFCRLLGHRRSRSRATFDDKRQQWVSDCRRCAIILVREQDGTWLPAPPAPRTLVPIDAGAAAAEQPHDATGEPEPAKSDAASQLEPVQSR